MDTSAIGLAAGSKRSSPIRPLAAALLAVLALLAAESYDCTVDLADGRQATARLRILTEDGDVRIVRLVPVGEGSGSGDSGK